MAITADSAQGSWATATARIPSAHRPVRQVLAVRLRAALGPTQDGPEASTKPPRISLPPLLLLSRYLVSPGWVRTFPSEQDSSCLQGVSGPAARPSPRAELTRPPPRTPGHYDENPTCLRSGRVTHAGQSQHTDRQAPGQGWEQVSQ